MSPHRYAFIEPPHLHVDTLAARLQSSRTLYLHISTPASLQRSIRLRLHTCSAPSVLHPSIPSRRSAFRDTVTSYSVRWPRKPSFRASRATRANPIKPHQNFTPAVCLQSSRSP